MDLDHRFSATFLLQTERPHYAIGEETTRFRRTYVCMSKIAVKQFIKLLFKIEKVVRKLRSMDNSYRILRLYRLIYKFIVIYKEKTGGAAQISAK